MADANVHPSLLLRKIVHVDMDAFYAAVEILDNPELRGKPVIVGGHPNGRGVVSTASYEARKFGIRSAMPAARAYRLCPQGIFVRPRFDRYVEISRQIRAIFARYTDLVEPLSLDEAYLDVTANKLGMFAAKIAAQIRADIYSEIGLTASAGVAPNKLIAKIASDFNKPNGMTVVLPEQVFDFMQKLSVGKIHGVGPVTKTKLESHGYVTCADLYNAGEAALTEKFGNSGPWLYRCSQGLCDRKVSISRTRKSYGKERTYSRDITDMTDIKAHLAHLCHDIMEETQRRNIRARCATLKVRYNTFDRITRAQTAPDFYRTADELFDTMNELLEKTEAGQTPIRLLGVSLSRLNTES